MKVRSSRRGLIVLAFLGCALFLTVSAGVAIVSAKSAVIGLSDSELLARAQAAYSRHHYSDAESMLAALLKKGNADREARLLYGEVLLELGRLKRAHAEFEAVNTEEGADFDALVGLARVYERQRQLDQAISSLAAASGIRPDDPRIFRLLGLAYEKRGDYPSALSSIRQSLKLLPDQEDLIQQLSILSSPSSMERQALHQADDPWELRPHERNRSTPMRSASEPPGQPWNPVDPTRHTHRHGSRSFP